MNPALERRLAALEAQQQPETLYLWLDYGMTLAEVVAGIPEGVPVVVYRWADWSPVKRETMQ